MTELNCDNETTFDLHLFPTITLVVDWPLISEENRYLKNRLLTDLDCTRLPDYGTLRLNPMLIHLSRSPVKDELF